MIHTPGSFTQIAMAWKLNCIEFGEFSEKYREEMVSSLIEIVEGFLNLFISY